MTSNVCKNGNCQTSNLMVAVAEGAGTVFVKISGRATCESGKNLKDLANQLTQRGYQQFVLDLTDCLIMDSTILGLVAGLGVKLAHSAAADGAGCVQLLNPSPRITDLLENLGVTQFFKITNGAPVQANQCRTVTPSAPAATREEIAQTSLDAHKFLMEINPDNVPKFKDVVRFLAEDLERLRTHKQ